jgi:Protein of unknown function (DUF3303)
MRFLFKVHIPVETGNAGAEEGFKTLQAILAQIKPEAAYFGLENGERTGFLVVNVNDASQIPAICEPFFLAFEASVDVTPVMTPDDLMKAAPAIDAAVKAFGAPAG